MGRWSGWADRRSLCSESLIGRGWALVRPSIYTPVMVASLRETITHQISLVLTNNFTDLFVINKKYIQDRTDVFHPNYLCQYSNNNQILQYNYWTMLSLWRHTSGPGCCWYTTCLNKPTWCLSIILNHEQYHILMYYKWGRENSFTKQ